MTDDRTGRWLAGFVVASLALHALLFGSANGKPREAPKRPVLVTMEVVQRPPPPAAPPPPPPRAAPRPVRRAIAVAPPAAPRPAPPPPAAAPPPVADFTGVTLTNDGTSGTGWASAVANGQPSKEPAGPPRAAPLPPAPAPAGPAVVPPADLRRAPEAPGLDEALARNYPEDARRQGLTGNAVIRARILADGHVRPLKVVSATAPAFAEACKRTLADSRWSQPLDREAKPCATDISYTCRFELGQ